MEERHLRRRGLPLALATLELDEPAVVVDLDNPRELDAHELRPSIVATRSRIRTQPQAATLYGHPSAPVGIRWWSTLEAGWLNVTLFAERAQRSLALVQVEPLTLELGATREAAEFIGAATPPRERERPLPARGRSRSGEHDTARGRRHRHR